MQRFALKKTKTNTVITHKQWARLDKNIIVIIGVTHSQCPVDTQVQWDEDKVIWKKVDSFGPALHFRVSRQTTSSTSQLWEEEGAEGIHLQFCCLTRAALCDQGQVEVDHLWQQKQKWEILNPE